MAKKAMINCLVCGKEVEQCHTCNKNVDEMLQWRRVVCCPEHFAFHLPIIQYVRGQISKAEAKAELDKAIKDYGEIDFADNIKSIVAEIMAEEKKVVKKKVKKTNEKKKEYGMKINEIRTYFNNQYDLICHASFQQLLSFFL